jgi:hypothetical protein
VYDSVPEPPAPFAFNPIVAPYAANPATPVTCGFTVVSRLLDVGFTDGGALDENPAVFSGEF